MEKPCPSCGALPFNGKDCQSIFDEFLVLEFTDPGFGQVHFLTVACYMIQHGRYSDEGQTWIKQQLHRHLEENIPVPVIQQEANQSASNRSRDWKVTRAPKDPPLSRVDWTMTIADLAQRYTDAESYCRLVTQWAKTTLAEMPSGA